jgi:hypothetical protein
VKLLVEQEELSDDPEVAKEEKILSTSPEAQSGQSGTVSSEVRTSFSKVLPQLRQRNSYIGICSSPLDSQVRPDLKESYQVHGLAVP